MSTRRRLAGVSLAFVAVAGFAVACGSSTNATPTSGQPSNGGGGNAMASYLACLRSNGVNLPNAGPSGRPFPTARPTARPSGAPRPSSSPGDGRRGGGGFPGGGFFGSTAPSGVPQETWDKARQACASLQPSFNPSNRPGRDNGAFAAYRNCLSDHGVTLNGPGNGQGNGQGQQLNTADPKTAAALKACEPLRPTARPSAS